MDLQKSIKNLVGYMRKSEIVKIFKKQNISVSTIYRTIKDCVNNVQIMNKSKGGRPQILDQKMFQNWLRVPKTPLERRPGILGESTVSPI